jgi:hypothetical protein
VRTLYRNPRPIGPEQAPRRKDAKATNGAIKWSVGISVSATNLTKDTTAQSTTPEVSAARYAILTYPGQVSLALVAVIFLERIEEISRHSLTIKG